MLYVNKYTLIVWERFRIVLFITWGIFDMYLVVIIVVK